MPLKYLKQGMKAIVYITGKIGTDTTLVDVIRQFKSFDSPDSLDAVIHSQGGNVEQGESIYTYLKGIDAEIPVTTITDKAYSIAAKIFAAGRERIVEDIDKALMIHFAWAKVEGNAERLEMVAEALRTMENDFASFYSEFLAIDEATVRNLLDNETFISGSEAVDFGFATKIKVTAEAVAELNIHESKNYEMTEKKKDKNFFKKLLADISAYLKEDDSVEINAEMTLQDSNGTDIVFPDLAAGDVPKVGDAATIDGAPIPDGSYIMPSVEESTLVFVSGKVSEVLPKETEVEVPAEVIAEEVQQISVWTMEVVNTTFAVGDVVKYKDWDGNEVTIGSGEFQLSDGRRVVTDATGVIVLIKEAAAAKEEEVQISAELTFDKLLEKVTKKAKEELKAEFEASLVLKDNEIKALKKKFGSKEFNAEEREQESAPEVKPSQASVLLTRTKKQ